MKMIQTPWFAIIIPLAFFLTSAPSFCQENTSRFSRQEFYAIMATDNSQKIDEMMSLLKKTEVSSKNAYEGALIMKKAGLLSGAAKKLSLFKQGRKQLDAEIAKDNDNAELRFLRLMIQEHAPGILGYRDSLEKDSAYIRQSFKKLPVDVQQAITDYCKTSKVLRSEDF